jgi:hypothetical protein
MRTNLEPAAGPLIAGFVVDRGTRRLLVRGIGPSLGRFGIAGGAPDVRLEVHQVVGPEDRLVAANDDWDADAAKRAGVDEMGAATGAFPLAAGSRDAALVLKAGNARTVHVYPVPAGAGGIALAEIYAAATEPGGRLANLSARSRVGSGEDVLIVGFVISGNMPKRLLIRGVGPTLATAFGIPGALLDPRIELHAAVGGRDVMFAANDNWGDESGAADAAGSVGAFALSTGSNDAALLVRVPAGLYTAVISSVGDWPGVGLVEIYDLDAELPRR